MYHRVLTRGRTSVGGSHPALVVERETFARSDGGPEAALHRDVGRGVRRADGAKTPFPDSTCLITFDDGWRDNFTNALPSLQAARTCPRWSSCR